MHSHLEKCNIFYRIEFQQRGSPHAHDVLWIKYAPNPESSQAEVITAFIDKYVSAALPSEEHDPELFTLVSQLQRHTHSAACRKTGKTCRFNFPKPIAEKKFISQPPQDDDLSPEQQISLMKSAANILSIV